MKYMKTPRPRDIIAASSDESNSKQSYVSLSKSSLSMLPDAKHEDRSRQANDWISKHLGVNSGSQEDLNNSYKLGGTNSHIKELVGELPIGQVKEAAEEAFVSAHQKDDK